MGATTKYIGPGVTNDYTDLSCWETAVQSGAALQTAILVADIVDNLVFSGWTTGGSVLIKGDLTGNIKRKITSAPGGAHVMHPTSGGMSILTLQDLLIDCGPQASAKNGINCSTGFATLTMERVTIKDAKNFGLNVATASLYEEGTIDNCIFNGNRYAIGLLEIAAENTTTFRNCLFTGATASSTMLLADNANQIAYFYNCISFDNAGDDFDNAEKDSLTYVNNCVSEDSSANDANHTVPSLGNAITQTALSSYFRDEDSDFRLLQDDYDNWGINGDSANTPALDYASVTRTNDDIGPYEFRRGAAAGVGSGVGFSAAKKHTFW